MFSNIHVYTCIISALTQIRICVGIHTDPTHTGRRVHVYATHTDGHMQACGCLPCLCLLHTSELSMCCLACIALWVLLPSILETELLPTLGWLALLPLAPVALPEVPCWCEFQRPHRRRSRHKTDLAFMISGQSLYSPGPRIYSFFKCGNWIVSEAIELQLSTVCC